MIHGTRKYFTYIYCFIVKDIIKHTDEWLDDMVHSMRSGRVPSAGASIPMELEHTIPRHTYSPDQMLSKSHTSGVFMEASSHKHEQLSLTQSLDPLPFPENGG